MIAAGTHAKAQSVETLRDLNRQSSMVNMVKPGTLDSNADQLLEGAEQTVVDRLLTERKWRWQVGADMGWYYNSNIFLTQNAIPDQIFRPGCGAVVYYGDTLAPLEMTAQYALYYNDYLNGTVASSFANNFTYSSTWRPSEKLGIQSAIMVSDSKGNNLDVGAQTRVLDTGVVLSGSYQQSERVSIGSDGAYSYRQYQNAGSYYDGNDYLFADYQFTPKLRMGLGGGGGARSLNGTTEIDTGARLRFNYVPGEKLSVNGLAGLESRSFSLGGNKVSPRVEIGSVYDLSERTQLRLSIYDKVSPSLGSTRVEIYQVDGVTASVSQRFFNKITASVGGGLERSTAQSSSSATAASAANQNYGYFQGSVVWNFLTYSSFSIYSKYLTRQSNVASAGLNYDQTLFGVELTMSY